MLQGLFKTDTFTGIVLQQLVNEVLGLLGEDHVISKLVGTFEGVGQDLSDGIVVEGQGPREPEWRPRYMK